MHTHATPPAVTLKLPRRQLFKNAKKHIVRVAEFVENSATPPKTTAWVAESGPKPTPAADTPGVGAGRTKTLKHPPRPVTPPSLLEGPLRSGGGVHMGTPGPRLPPPPHRWGKRGWGPGTPPRSPPGPARPEQQEQQRQKWGSLGRGRCTPLPALWGTVAILAQGDNDGDARCAAVFMAHGDDGAGSFLGRSPLPALSAPWACAARGAHAPGPPPAAYSRLATGICR